VAEGGVPRGELAGPAGVLDVGGELPDPVEAGDAGVLVPDERLTQVWLLRAAGDQIPRLVSRVAGAAPASACACSARRTPPIGPELRSYALPLPFPAVPVVMAWHLRHERDSAHRWLRDLIAGLLTSVTHPAGRRNTVFSERAWC
jgi:DNA-binding transcriptional LysR family regulator